MSISTCKLDVRAEDFLSAVMSLDAAQRSGRGVQLSFRDGQLELRRGITSVRVPAAGSWPATAIVHVSFVKDVLRRRKAFPQTFSICGTDDMLHLSHYRIPCKWENSSS